MPPSRLVKSMAEKKEVVTWIEKHGETPTKAADHFQNERDWKVSAVQIRYWWKHKESIKNAPVSNLRLMGAGAKPWLAEVEDMIFDQVLFLRTGDEARDISRELAARAKQGTGDFSMDADRAPASGSDTGSRYSNLLERYHLYDCCGAFNPLGDDEMRSWFACRRGTDSDPEFARQSVDFV
ncbi:hypothetical protein JG688_00015060 [Phytophthora aleatoria]|uniref:Uncharacterized protein n=1 Tax=Phytophthora aleatoria TaxID=2496075 RepID=A0A8J5IU29_9STRA|nr:hypothetical protein JG688_00015060 [Phytophthora aleatoria]